MYTLCQTTQTTLVFDPAGRPAHLLVSPIIPLVIAHYIPLALVRFPNWLISQLPEVVVGEPDYASTHTSYEHVVKVPALKICFFADFHRSPIR